MNTFWVHKNWKWKKENATAKYIDEHCEEAVTLADAQATVEALQAQLEAAERHNTILQDANKVALEKVEALQRERDHAKKMEAVQTEVADNQTWHVRELRAALDAEREKVKGLHEITKVICTHCCEPMEIPSKAVLQTQLTQLQALVWALPVVKGEIRNIGQNVVNGEHNYLSRLDSGLEAGAYTALLRYRATLDATTPAPIDAAETHDRMFNHTDRHPEAL